MTKKLAPVGEDVYLMWMVKTKFLAPGYGISYRRADLTIPRGGHAVRVVVTEHRRKVQP